MHNRSVPVRRVELESATRTHSRVARRAVVALLTAATVVTASCGEAVRTGRSPVVLLITRLEGASGADPATFSNVLHSDVETLVAHTAGGVETSVPTLFADPGRVELRLALKDVGQPGSPASPSDNNAVTITRYRVSYRRSDGRGVPGVDVPFAFDGAATVTIDATGSAPLALELVRVQAKHEAPLRNLRGGGGALAISTVADVTFYGHDTVGHEISAVGAISVVFADWPDPQ
jgi:hypothetical protein